MPGDGRQVCPVAAILRGLLNLIQGDHRGITPQRAVLVRLSMGVRESPGRSEAIVTELASHPSGNTGNIAARGAESALGSSSPLMATSQAVADGG